MNQKTARAEIVREWSKLPPEKRTTRDQAVAFILTLMSRRPDVFQFKYRNNPVEIVLGWIYPSD